MRPPNGPVVVHAADGQGHETTVTYNVADDGIMTTFGLLKWKQSEDCFRLGSIAMRCNGNGTGVALNGPEEYALDCHAPPPPPP